MAGDFEGDRQPGGLGRAHQVGLLRAGQMEDVGLGAVPAHQLDDLGHRGDAAAARPAGLVLAVAAGFAPPFVEEGEQLAVLGVQHQLYPALGGCRERLLQHGRVAHDGRRGVVSGHEELGAGGDRTVQAGQQFRVLGVHADVEGVVGQRVALDHVGLVGHGLRGQRRRQGVGHVHHRGEAAGDRGPAAVLPVLLVRQAGGAEVDVGVDEARQDIVVAGVHAGHGRGGGVLVGEGGDASAGDQDVARADPVRGHQPACRDHQIRVGQGGVQLRHVRATSSRARSFVGPISATARASASSRFSRELVT